VPSDDTEPTAQALPGGASQVVQLDAASSENVPAPHDEQVEAEEAPSSAENLPASHDEHVEAPSAENLPASHDEQLEAPSAEKLPALHAWQALLPVPFLPSWLYFPATHAGGSGHGG